jgi:DNA repair protein RadC
MASSTPRRKRDVKKSLAPTELDLNRPYSQFSDAALATMLLEGEGGCVAREAAVVDPGNAEEVGRLIQVARELWERKLAQDIANRPVVSDPSAVREFVRLRLGSREHEVFAVLFLDAQHRVIAFDELFRGTLTQTSVYPREIVKVALRYNAAAILMVHNHPSGQVEPSRADELLTKAVKGAMALVDVRVLDHFIVSKDNSLSFAERGLL